MLGWCRRRLWGEKVYDVNMIDCFGTLRMFWVL